MKPAPFAYHLAASVDDAVRTLAEAGGDAKVIAGGQSLAPLLNLRLARPSLLVDVNRIAGLDGIDRHAASVRVGALVRHAALVRQDAHPLLAEAARFVGHPAIRTRGTLGGSLAHADPAAELPVVAVALGAVAHVQGPAGARTLPAGELFTGPLQTALRPDELIVAVDFPLPDTWGFAEFSRRHGDFALALAATARFGDETRIAVGGVAGTPLLLAGASELERAPAFGDVHGPAEYRRALAAECVRRASERMRP
ncbi:MAG TPA: FAD binding domain-containing protein [Gaiellaceae bacterium]|nr:FAD binding domain-containing protein [Gaiellaceae bacterium]